MVGQAGSVILFVVSGVALVIVGSYFIAFAARSYMVVVQGTSVGLDKVDWPDESPVDWLGQSATVLFQLLLWIMPAGFLARALASSWLPDNAPLRFFILMGGAAWLLFPAGFLLTMSTAGAGAAAGRLLKALPALLLFYVLTAGLFAAALGLLYFGLFTPAWYALPVAAALGPAVLLIHARLVGRLGWLIGRREEVPAKEKKRRKKRKRVPVQSHDPWAVPEEDDEPIEAEAESDADADDEPVPFKMTDEVKEEPKRRKPSYEEDVPDPYSVADQPEPEQQPVTKLEMEKDQVEREVKLRKRVEPEPPKSLFFAGVWEFPLYPSTHRAWAFLIIFAQVCGGIARFMISVSPFGGGG
jgi:hypothetical protein